MVCGVCFELRCRPLRIGLNNYHALAAVMGYVNWTDDLHVFGIAGPGDAPEGSSGLKVDIYLGLAPANPKRESVEYGFPKTAQSFEPTPLFDHDCVILLPKSQPIPFTPSFGQIRVDLGRFLLARR